MKKLAAAISPIAYFPVSMNLRAARQNTAQDRTRAMTKGYPRTPGPRSFICAGHATKSEGELKLHGHNDTAAKRAIASAVTCRALQQISEPKKRPSPRADLLELRSMPSTKSALTRGARRRCQQAARMHERRQRTFRSATGPGTQRFHR